MAEILQLKKGRGGYRPGAGRKPGPSRNKDVSGRYVYVVHEECDSSICKIGVAKDPYKRLSSLQVSNWRRLKLAAVISAPSDPLAGSIESHAHGVLSALHVTGEWFRVSPERAAEEIRTAARNLGIEFSQIEIVVSLEKKSR